MIETGIRSYGYAGTFVLTSAGAGLLAAGPRAHAALPRNSPVVAAALAGGAWGAGQRQVGPRTKRHGPVARLLAQHQEAVGEVVCPDQQDVRKERDRNDDPHARLGGHWRILPEARARDRRAPRTAAAMAGGALHSPHLLAVGSQAWAPLAINDAGPNGRENKGGVSGQKGSCVCVATFYKP